MKKWGQRAAAMMVSLLMLGVSACSYMEYQGVQGSKAQPVSYSETNGKIDIDSICAEQRDHHKAFYSCAVNADVWLDHQCNSYRGLYMSSDTGTAQRYRQEYYKFCDASSAWQKPERGA